jgi:outer membrane PBP1 activator LpoA protein
MFTATVRFALATIASCYGVYLISAGDRTGVLGLAVAALLVYGYFRYGTVWLAFRAAQQDNIERARRLLSQIKYPSLLASQSRAYYELLAGHIALSQQQESTAETHFRTSLNYRLRTQNDRCLAEVTLAEILAKSGRTAEAREFVAHANSRFCRPEIRERIEQVAAMVS